MPLLKKFYGTGFSPDYYDDPKTGHIVIRGQAFDPNTLLPTINTPHTDVFDDNTSSPAWSESDIAGTTSAGHINEDAAMQWGSMFGQSGLTVNRYITTAGTGHSTDTNQWCYRQDLHGRDFWDAPAFNMFYSPFTKVYYHTTPVRPRDDVDLNNWYAYEGDGEEYVLGTDCISGDTSALVWMYYGHNENGWVGVRNVTNATWNNNIRSTTYSNNNRFLSGDGNNDIRNFVENHICKLTELNDGTPIMWNQSFDNATIGRRSIWSIDKDTWLSTTTLANEYADNGTWSTTSYIPSVPSNVVRHNNSGDATNNHRKVCYDNRFGATNFTDGFSPYRIVIDVETGNVATDACTVANTNVVPYYEAWADADDQTDPNNFWTESRILSPNGHTLTSQKYLMLFGSQLNSVTHGTANEYDHVDIYEIDSADDTSLTRKSVTNLRELTGIQAGYAMPWGVAPLNDGHTTMVWFFQTDTCIIRFNETSKTLELVASLGIRYQSFTAHKSGRVIAICRDQGYSYRGKEAHVLTEDIVYRVDFTPDVEYLTYDGTGTQTANVGINAFDANTSQIAATIQIEIEGGNARWTSGNNVIKNITTSATANTVEQITIIGDGFITLKANKVAS